eukprot:symbB.v1.2.021858.t1/scaffold1914.1/size96239/5
MGGDGGQVIDRATMVKTKGWGLTKGSGDRYAASLGEMNSYMQMVFEDRGLGTLERHRLRMSTCMISQEALRDPVVAMHSTHTLEFFFSSDGLGAFFVDKF